MVVNIPNNNNMGRYTNIFYIFEGPPKLQNIPKLRFLVCKYHSTTLFQSVFSNNLVYVIVRVDKCIIGKSVIISLIRNDHRKFAF
jgi:hypothetical protein